MIGTSLSHYRILEKLGEGGMGVVYKAEDVVLGRLVALKILLPDHTADPHRLARFRQEAKTASSLSHPHICTIHEVDEADGVYFIAMEFVDGDSLRGEIAAHGMELHRLLRLATEVAEALSKAHEQGITHRDIKPENILVSRDGYAKIADFGLSKLRDPAADSELTTSRLVTAPGTVLGTALYMSPEQAQGRPLDGRSDIFSFGLVLYEMATGRVAFERATALDTMHGIVHDPLPQDPLTAAVSPELAAIVEKATRKDPDDRYQSARDMAVDLRRLQRDSAAVARRLGARPTGRRGLNALSVAVVGLTLLAAAGTLWMQRFASPSETSTSPPDILAGKARLVVLPFENLTRQPSDDWLAGGFSDSLTFGLQNVNALILVTRERISELYREYGVEEARTLDPGLVQKLTRLLQVRYYVYGSYQKVGDEIKVVAKLVEAGSGTIRAQESATDHFTNILKLEDELARRLAASLELRALVADTRTNTSSVAAYQALTEGRTLYAAVQYKEALSKFQQAVHLDQTYAQGWALLAKTFARSTRASDFSGGFDLGEYRRQALAAARRAVELDSALPDAHVALALAYLVNRQVVFLRGAARRAIELNPREAEPYSLLGDSYMATIQWGCSYDRNPALAEEYFRTAQRVDPGSAGAYYALIAHLFRMGQVKEALNVVEEGLRAVPEHVRLREVRLLLLVALNRLDEAERELPSPVRQGLRSVNEFELAGFLDLKRGRVEAGSRNLDRALSLAPTPIIELDAAYFYFECGHFDRGVIHLDRALRQEPACASWVADMPQFVGFVAHPAVRSLLTRYGVR